MLVIENLTLFLVHLNLETILENSELYCILKINLYIVTSLSITAMYFIKPGIC
jgi:hypothetical protein